MFFYTWFDPQKTSYGFGYSSPNSLAGLIHAPREDPSFSSVFGGSICRWAAWWSPSSIWSGGHLRHQVLILGGALHQTHLHETQHLGIRKAQVAAILVQAMPGTGGPKSWPMATSHWQVRRSIGPVEVAMAARRIVTASKQGGLRCRQFHHLSCLHQSQ